MEILDSQIHMWAPESAQRPWLGGPEHERVQAKLASEHVRARARELAPHEPPVTCEANLSEMDRLGIRGALIYTTYRYLNSNYEFEAAAQYPERFRVVNSWNPFAGASDVDEYLTECRRNPHWAGIRILIQTEDTRDALRAGLYAPLFAAAQRQGVPLGIYPPGYLGEVQAIAQAYPDLTIVLDHLGLRQPPLHEIGGDPWADLDQLLALANFPHVAVKLSGAPTLSREPFPFLDLWPRLHQIIDAFGPGRLMWGSDWTRVRTVVSYDDGLHFFTDTDQLSESDKQWILGQTVRKIFGWSQHAAAAVSRH